MRSSAGLRRLQSERLASRGAAVHSVPCRRLRAPLRSDRLARLRGRSCRRTASPRRGSPHAGGRRMRSSARRGSARRAAGSESADLIASDTTELSSGSPTKPTLHLILESLHVDGRTVDFQRWMWRRSKPASSTVTSRLDSSSLIVDVPGPQGAVLSAKATVGAAWARRRGTQSPPTRAPARAWRRPRKKRRCRWPPCGHCTRMGRRALWRASELRCGGHQSFRGETDHVHEPQLLCGTLGPWCVQ